MFKRILYNSETGEITGTLPTSMSKVFVSNNLEIYCELNGETNISELPIKSLLIEKLSNNIKGITTNIVDNGFEYNETNFCCNQEAQQIYTGLYVVKDTELVTYPYNLIDGNTSNSVSLSSADELGNFCSQVLTHIQTQHGIGKSLSDSLEALSIVDLVNYEDVRTV